MLTELKRCNCIGNIAGIEFVYNIISSNIHVTTGEVVNRCSFEAGINVNCKGLIAFFQYLGLIEVDSETITKTNKLISIDSDKTNTTIQKIANVCIKQLFDDGVFDSECFTFNSENGKTEILPCAFPLSYAAIRNFLISAEVLKATTDGEFTIQSEDIFTEKIRQRYKKISLEQLIKQKEAQSKQGLDAEEFVLKLEKAMNPTKADKIKRISDFDVTAGYDIASFADDSSIKYDRFIEVKSYIGFPHFFWSENEVSKAKLLGKRYVICLVNYKCINQIDYVPEYIVNPYQNILGSAYWLVDVASYKIQKV